MARKKIYQKLGISHLDKTYFVGDVSKKNYEKSLDIETAGLFDVFKIKSKKGLQFRARELEKKGYRYKQQ